MREGRDEGCASTRVMAKTSMSRIGTPTTVDSTVAADSWEASKDGAEKGHV
jgi:hypothetical protein